MKELFEESISKHGEAIKSLVKNEKEILGVAELIIKTINQGNTVYIAGNGGSASDAQHFAAELIGRFRREREAYSSVCLNTDTSIMTAVANDYGYDTVFSRQLSGLAKKGDVFVAISTSGNSINLLKALEVTEKKGVISVGLLGKNGGKMKELCNHSIVIEGDETAHIQEAHITIIHIICKIVEESLVE